MTRNLADDWSHNGRRRALDSLLVLSPVSKVKSLSCVQLFATPWTVVCQAPPSMRFPRQEYWSGCHFILQGNLPTRGSNPGFPHYRQTLDRLSRQKSPVSKATYESHGSLGPEHRRDLGEDEDMLQDFKGQGICDGSAYLCFQTPRARSSSCWDCLLASKEISAVPFPLVGLEPEDCCGVRGVSWGLRRENLLALSVYNSSVLTRVKGKWLQMFALLSMALRALKELVPGVLLPVHPTASLRVCLDGLCTVFLRPPFEMVASLLSPLPYINNVLVFLLVSSRCVVPQFPGWVTINWDVCPVPFWTPLCGYTDRMPAVSCALGSGITCFSSSPPRVKWNLLRIQLRK